MSVPFLVDVHVNFAIVQGLRLRGVDVMTAQEMGIDEAADDIVLQSATLAGRVVFTNDRDFLGIAAGWQSTGRDFGGVVYCHPLKAGPGKLVQDLELISKCLEPEDVRNRVEHLPF